MTQAAAEPGGHASTLYFELKRTAISTKTRCSATGSLCSPTTRQRPVERAAPGSLEGLILLDMLSIVCMPDCHLSKLQS